MYLKTIKTQNYQSHKNSILNLVPGVNIISGPSDNGKTDILRSANLVISNRPSGFNYKPWHLAKDKKAITVCSLEFDDGTVERRKSDTIDEYTLTTGNGKEEVYSSLNRQVPDDIQSFINLKDYNFQQQGDEQQQKSSLFFIGESPGERAKMLNSITGLEIVDTSLSNINSMIRENTAEQKKIDKEIKETSEKIEKIAFVEDADKILVHLESLFTKNEQLGLVNKALEGYIFELSAVEQEIRIYEEFLLVRGGVRKIRDQLTRHSQIVDQNTILERYISQMEEVQETIDINSEFLKCKQGFLPLKLQIKKFGELNGPLIALKKYVEEFSEVDETIQLTSEWLKCKVLWKALDDKIFEHDVLESENRDLGEWMDKVIYYDDTISEMNSDLKQLKEKKKQYLVDLGECPLCGSVIK